MQFKVLMKYGTNCGRFVRTTVKEMKLRRILRSEFPILVFIPPTIHFEQILNENVQNFSRSRHYLTESCACLDLYTVSYSC